MPRESIRPRSNVDDAEASAPNPKRVRSENIDTRGLEEPVLKQLLDEALLQYSSQARLIVERHRPTVYQALSTQNIRDALVNLAESFPSIAVAIQSEKSKDEQPVLKFSTQMNDAYLACHSLDDLKPSKQYTHSGDASSGVTQALDEILEQISADSHPTTLKNAAEAIADIASSVLDTWGEIGNCLRQEIGSDLRQPLDDTLALMDNATKQSVVKTLRKLDNNMQDYGIYVVQEVLEEHSLLT